jgi:internalin A
MVPNLPALRALLPKATPTRAWKAVRELAIVAPQVTRPALELAGQFAEIAFPPTERLLKIWQQTPDPDGFAEFVVAPAFAREGRTELTVGGDHLPVGLRHLTTLRRIEPPRADRITDISELAGLTGLTSLDLHGADRITDFSPLAALTGLETLNLRGTRIRDLAPLLGMRHLTDLDLSGTEVASLEGIADAFPLLSRLRLAGCDEIDDLGPLAGATNLRSLDLWRLVTDLTGLRDLPALEELALGDGLASLDGLNALPSVRKLNFGYKTDLERLDNGGPYLHITELSLPYDAVPDLGIVSRFPGLTEITLWEVHAVASLEGLRGHPSLAKVDLYRTAKLKDLSPLRDLPALRELRLENLSGRSLTQLAGMPPLQKLDITDSKLTTLTGIPETRSLDLFRCKQLSDLTALDDGLEQLSILGCPSIQDLRQITRLRGLKSLSVPTDRVLRINSLTDLHELQALTELTINTHEPVSLAGIEGLPALRTLDFARSNPVTDLDKVSHPHLAKLGLHHRPLRDLRWVTAFPALTEILITPECELTSLEELAGHPSITRVGAFGPELKDLSVLATLPALRELRIGRVDDFDNVTLPALPLVEKLTIRWVPRLRTLDGLPELPALRALDLYDCPELTDLGPLRDVPATISLCPKLA